MFNKGNNEQKLYSLLSVILWVFASFALWEFVCELSHEIGAIVSKDPEYAVGEVLRMMPHTLLLVGALFAELFLNNAFTAVNLEARVKNWKIMGRFLIIVSAINVLYVCVGVATGIYFGFVEGSPTALYPLDAVLCALIFGFCGFFFNKYAAGLKEKGSSISFAKEGTNGAVRAILRTFGFLGMLLSNYAFASWVYSFFEMDYTHGGVFLNLCVFINYFIPVAMFFVYRFVYLSKEDEDKPDYLKTVSLWFLVINIASLALYILASKIYFDALSTNCPGLFPADNISSAYLFPLIYGINNILTPLVSFACGVMGKSVSLKKNK